MPAPPTRLDHLRSLRIANLDVAFATAFGTLVGGTFLVGFVRHLGGSDLWIGILTALPSLLGVLQIPGAIWGRSYSGFRSFIIPGGWIWRLLYLPLIALPLLALNSEFRLWVLALCIGLGSSAVLLVSPIYNDWLAEMVPANSRGWYFSRRNAIAAAVGATIGVGGGFVLDQFRRQNHESAGFSVIFGIGFICALISMFFFLQMQDVPRPNPIKQTLKEAMLAFRDPIRDRAFRPVLTFFVVAVFAQAFGGNLFGAYALETLNMPFTVLQFCGASHALGHVLAGRFWGFVADKYGNKPTLVILMVGIGLTPLMWVATTPGEETRNAIILIAGHIYTGAMWSGVALCQFNLLLATAKPEDRANYIGVGMAVQALIAGISPLVGAMLMSTLRLPLGGEQAYKAVFLTVCVLRLGSVLCLAPVRESGAIRLREALRGLRRISPTGYRAMKDLQTGGAEAREQAIQSVAERQFALAGDEVRKALHDPSPRMRRQAAIALARLNEPGAVEALLHQLQDHPALVEEETVEALGLLGATEAVPELIHVLQSPRSALRRAAAKALAQIGSADAIEPLMAAARDPNDTELRRASLQALRELGDAQCEPAVADALLDPHPSVRIAAAEAVAELNLVGAAASLRESLDRYTDEAQSELAYALGCVGSLSDASRILQEAEACVSMITRRRCLLGIARLLGCEDEAYRLLMLDGMSRDAAMLDLVRPFGKDAKKLRASMQRFSAGDEAGALVALASWTRDDRLRQLAEQPVAELYVVAFASATRPGPSGGVAGTGIGRSD